MILHSQITGEGKPIVVLHGFLGMSDNWRTMGNWFTEAGYQVHLLDLRNHGRSFHHPDFSYDLMVSDVKTYCEDRNLQEIILLGHSMGGKVAMLFASRYSRLTKKLIVADIAPKAYPPHHQQIMDALNALDFSVIQSRKEADSALAQRIKERSVRLFLLKNLYRKNKTGFGLRLNLPVLSEKLDAIGEALPDNAYFEGDSLFIAGGRSNYIQESDRDLIKKHFPRSEIKTIHDTGHWLHAEKPEEFYEICMDFIKK